MRVQPARPSHLRLGLLFTAMFSLAAGMSGLLGWAWTQAACIAEMHGPIRLPVSAAARASWRLIFHGGWSEPARAFPTRALRHAAPPLWAYLLVAVLLAAAAGWLGLLVWRRVRGWQAGSPLGKPQRSLARRAVERGWVHQRTWALPSDLRRLWVTGPASGRPYLGFVGGRARRMLAAEPEIQPMVVAPPRAGKTTGYVIPWLLEHDGPALVLSTKRDVYEATVQVRRQLGRVWVYDPFGESACAGFSPLVPAATWAGAIRAGEAIASGAHPDQANAAAEFWDREAASMLSPLLHAAALERQHMSEVIRWLDARDFQDAVGTLKRAGALAAAEQLEGVGRRDERNRETTVMSALNLLRAYRYPQVAAAAGDDLTPQRFLDGHANTIYVVADGHDQEPLRPVILTLVAAVYHHAIGLARRYGPLNPRLYAILDEAANIAPIRQLASWLSQCGDHGIVIATIWQSIAQIDQRYGRPARDAICAASTAQLFIPPLAEPTTTGYLTELLGEESIATASTNSAGVQRSLSAGQRKSAPAPWLRQIPRGRAILLYRDLPPAVVQAPGWYEDRFSAAGASSKSVGRVPADLTDSSAQAAGSVNARAVRPRRRRPEGRALTGSDAGANARHRTHPDGRPA